MNMLVFTESEIHINRKSYGKKMKAIDPNSVMVEIIQSRTFNKYNKHTHHIY